LVALKYHLTLILIKSSITLLKKVLVYGRLKLWLIVFVLYTLAHICPVAFNRLFWWLSDMHALLFMLLIFILLDEIFLSILLSEHNQFLLVSIQKLIHRKSMLSCIQFIRILSLKILLFQNAELTLNIFISLSVHYILHLNLLRQFTFIVILMSYLLLKLLNIFKCFILMNFFSYKMKIKDYFFKLTYTHTFWLIGRIDNIWLKLKLRIVDILLLVSSRGRKILLVQLVGNSNYRIYLPFRRKQNILIHLTV
jgi:hypothetical protein